MELRKGKFESLHHNVYGGEVHEVPLYVDRELGLTNESNALLHAVNIFAGNLTKFDNDIDNILERMAILLEGEEGTAFILEDEHGAGAVEVDSQLSTVSVAEVGKWVVPTPLLFDMVYTWSQIANQTDS